MHKHSRPQKLLAEALGTFFIVLASGGAICAAAYLRGGPSAPLGQSGLLTTALVYGTAYALAIATLGPISGGHFNPAVTVGHWVTHRFGTIETVLYFAAQLGGAIGAAYCLRAAAPASVVGAGLLGPPALAAGLTRGPAMLIEAAMTFLLVLALWSTIVGRERPRYWLGGIVAGVVIVAASIAGARFTGAPFIGTMNPARAFGPALAMQQWAYQGVYWVGPLAGGVVAASLYDLLFRRGLRHASPVAQPLP